ncbi:MAG: AarF/UbiB family protein [Myxococcota bacterium]
MRLVRPIVRTLGDLRAASQNVARLREVGAILVRHGYGSLVRGVPGVDAVDAPPPPTTPERLAAALVDLGPTYVKLAQVLSTRPDVLPPAYVAAFEQLQDGVGPLPWEAMAAVLAEELGPDWDRRFAAVDQAPLGTASIAQVHAAELPDGREVVLKVQRPGIARQIDADLQVLRFLAGRALAEWPELAAADPEGLLAEFERTLRGELDFRREADHLRRFRANFAHRDWVHVPDLHDDLVTERVLCMERLHGVPIRRARAAGADMEKVGRRYLDVVYEMLLVHGFFHGDLHPGNVLVLPGDELGLLDFGMVGTMTDAMRGQVVALMFALQRGDHRTMARVLYDIALKDGRIDFRAVEDATVEVVTAYFPPGVRLADIDMSGFSVELVTRCAQLGARVPTSYMMVLKALVTAEGLAKSLLHEVDVIAAAAPYFATVAADRLAPERLQQEALYALVTLRSLLDRLPVTVSQLLDDVDGQRLRVGVDARRSPEDRALAERHHRRSVLAAFAAAALIAGALTIASAPAATLALWVLAAACAGLALFA